MLWTILFSFGIAIASIIASLVITKFDFLKSNKQDNNNMPLFRINSLKSNFVDREMLDKLLPDMIDFARLTKPDWIVGIHTGGRLLSALVADEIGVPKNRCVFAHTESVRSPQLCFKNRHVDDVRKLDGTILVIDDIMRTGKTIELVRAGLTVNTLTSGVNCDIRFAVLVYCQPAVNAMKSHFQLNWWCGVSADPNMQLPWSKLSAAIRMAYASKAKGHNFDRRLIDFHERLSSDFDFALGVMKKYRSGAKPDIEIPSDLGQLKAA